MVTPSVDATYWRTVVRQAAEGAGLAVVEIDVGEVPEGDADCVLLTNDPRTATQFDPTRWGVIWSRPSTGGGTETAVLIHVSGIMAALSMMPAGTEILTDRDLIGSVEPKTLFGRFAVAHKHAPLSVWEATNQTASIVLSMYDEGPPKVGTRCEWVPDAFFYDEKASSTIGHMGGLPISGVSRPLVSGPHLSLPPGVWKATATFSVDDLAGIRNYRVEWGGPSGFTTAHFSPGKAGIYRLEVERRWSEAEPAELRLVLAESALSGELRFQGAVVEMIAA